MNRRLLLIIGLVLLLVAGLVGFYLFLTGGGDAGVADEPPPPSSGIIPVRSIYTAGNENLYRPVGIGSDDAGNFYVTLRDSQKIVAFDRDGDFIRLWGERGTGAGQMLTPLGVDYDPATRHVYVTDRARLRLITFDADGKYLFERPLLNPLTPTVTQEGVAITTFGPIVLLSSQGEVIREVGTRGPTPGQFDYPRGIAELANGDFVVADTNNTRVQSIKLSGEATAVTNWVVGEPPRFQDDPQTQYGVPASVAVDDQGRVYVLDGFRHFIDVLDARNGKRIHKFEDMEGQSDGRFYLPSGIAYLGDDYFAVTDTFNDRVQIIRLLLPEDNNWFNRNRWVLWLLPLLLLPLLFFLFRKRYFVTEETLQRAEKEGQLRLLAAVFKRMRVLPDVFERFKHVTEEGVAIGAYLEVVGEDDESEAEGADTRTAVERLAAASKPKGMQRLLLPRIRIVCADEPQCIDFEQLKLNTISYDEVIETYAIDKPGEGGGETTADEESVEPQSETADSDAREPEA